jgi:hypothetical protein
MAPPPIMLPGITWLILQGVVPASIDVVGAPSWADAQGTPEEHALTLVAPAPISLAHITTPMPNGLC